MTAQTYSEVKQGIVHDMRVIREQISHEIKDMSFEQERAYLDELLFEKKKASAQHRLGASGADE